MTTPQLNSEVASMTEILSMFACIAAAVFLLRPLIASIGH
jgi:hypothetical protein